LHPVPIGTGTGRVERSLHLDNSRTHTLLASVGTGPGYSRQTPGDAAGTSHVSDAGFPVQTGIRSNDAPMACVEFCFMRSDLTTNAYLDVALV